MPKWYKLDNAAKIYPSVVNSQWEAIFRMSVDLTEDVDPNILQQAQKRVLERLPAFATTLKHGFFWFYLEHIDGQPPIEEDIKNPMQKINRKRNNQFMYRLLYYKNRIAVEFFHSLTDGTGGMTFLMTLVNEYLRIKHGTKICPSRYILNCDDEPDPEEYEDSFLRYGGKKTLGIAEKRSYQYPHTHTDFNRLLIVSGSVKTESLRKLAQKYDCKIGSFTTALLIYSALQLQKADTRASQKKKPVKVCSTINLRKMFPSRTLRNFSAFVNPGLYGILGDYSLAEVVEYVKHFMGMYVNKKQQLAKFSYNVDAERNIFIRIAPLFIKIPILIIAYIVAGDVNQCSTMSNLGLLDLPEEVGRYVKRADFMLGRSFFNRSSCACVSYDGTTVFNFTRNIKESELERIFFSTLVEEGVEVFIESNGRD